MADEIEQAEEVKGPEPKATYTSHPIMNYRLGKFIFERGTLKLFTDDDVKEFEKMHSKQPAIEKTRVRKVDLEAAERIIAEMQTRTSKIVTGVGDSGTPTPTGAENAKTAASTPISTAKSAIAGVLNK